MINLNVQNKIHYEKVVLQINKFQKGHYLPVKYPNNL